MVTTGPERSGEWLQLGHWLRGKGMGMQLRTEVRELPVLREEGQCVRVCEVWTLLTQWLSGLPRTSRATPESITKTRTGTRLLE